jgi:hypothetical protein
MRKHAKKDLCHNPITVALAMAGCAVMDLSGIGDGAPDLLCVRGNITRVFEFKGKYGKFTPDQIKWQNDNPRFAQYYRKIKTVQEAFLEMGLK